MDFFQHQDRARRSTGRLVFLYLCAMLCIMLTLYLPIAYMVWTMGQPFTGDKTLDQLATFGIVAAIVGLVIGGGTLFKVAELARGGGRAVAEMLGGRVVNPNTRDLSERQLLNVVEEVALAAGMNVPTVYVMDGEESINAFAAGYSPNEAVVAVTRGTMTLLNRDELQGVIAHEFSHILNGDMRINIKLIGTLFGLELIVLIGWMLLRAGAYSGGARRSSNKNNGAGAAIVAMGFGLLVVIVGSVGMFFSAVIKAAISRQREYLADASAVQFTRNPLGIAGALKKIGCPRIGSAVGSPQAAEVAHMFFGNAFSGAFLRSLFATHPDLKDRIKRIDPQFDGKFPSVIHPVRPEARGEGRGERGEGKKSLPFPIPIPGIPTAFPGAAALSGGTPGSPSPFSPLPSPLNRVGQLDPAVIVATATLLDTLPEELVEALREPAGAKAVAYLVLLDTDADSSIRAKQLGIIQRRDEAGCYSLVSRLASQVPALPVEVKIPLVQKAFPALRTLATEQYKTFRDIAGQLVAADGKIDLFEYAIKGMLLRNLDICFGLAREEAVRYTTVATIRVPVTYLLSYLAYSGHTELDAATRAFSAAMRVLSLDAEPVDSRSCNLNGFDSALRTLAAASPQVKKRLLEAVLACVADDGQVTPREAELVRAICAMLGIPMPAFAGS